MNVFETIKKDILASLSGWVQINDNNTSWTVEDFSYETGVIEELVKPHCVKCVAVNQCWFKNDKSKKPEHFNYEKYGKSYLLKSCYMIFPNGKLKNNTPIGGWTNEIFR